MCGICGYISSDQDNTNMDTIYQMAECLIHRGPDNLDCYNFQNVFFGHTRLSIQDLSEKGNQPFSSKDKHFVIIFNGEIYNHNEIKAELINVGYHFSGTSDTETILNGYIEWGNNIFKKLNGIFSIAILNKENNQVVLARDRFGVKPLYFATLKNTLVFSSEIKSILKHGLEVSLNYKSLHEFLYYGYCLNSKTFYNEIQKLIPGSLMILDTKTLNSTTEVFWQHEDIFVENDNARISEKQAVLKTKELLENAVKKQLLSDVPIGVFLSGGIDSSAITAFASRHYSGKLKSFSAGFDFNKTNDELPVAKELARLFNTEHHEIFIEGKNISQTIEKLIEHHDEPFSDAANIPLYLMGEQVKKECKVVLQGDGGDELFGGYPRYDILQNLAFYQKSLKIGRQVVKFFPSRALKSKIDRFSFLIEEENPAEICALLMTLEKKNEPFDFLSLRVKEKISISDPFEHYKNLNLRFKNINSITQKMLWIDSLIVLPELFLEKVDKSTMANGIESRVPFLDNELSNFALSLPSELKIKRKEKKFLLKKALDGIVPNKVLYGKKKGFGVPFGSWLKGPLLDHLKSSLLSPTIKELDIFDFDKLKTMISDHASSKKDYSQMLWRLFNLSIWLQKYDVKV